jgi:hypothetical protein
MACVLILSKFAQQTVFRSYGTMHFEGNPGIIDVVIVIAPLCRHCVYGEVDVQVTETVFGCSLWWLLVSLQVSFIDIEPFDKSWLLPSLKHYAKELYL